MGSAINKGNWGTFAACPFEGSLRLKIMDKEAWLFLFALL